MTTTTAWTDVAALDIQRDGDALQVWITLADERRIPLAKTSLVDRTRTKLPVVEGMVRVRDVP